MHKHLFFSTSFKNLLIVCSAKMKEYIKKKKQDYNVTVPKSQGLCKQGLFLP